MADRCPLIANPSTSTIQEIPSDDTLDLTGNNIKGAGIITATTFSGNLTGTATTATNLADAANITTGTIADARFPATLPAVSGENLTNLPASGDSNDITACLFI